MKYFVAIFILGCYLSIGRCEECRVLHYTNGIIYKSLSSPAGGANWCYNLPLSTGKFIQLRMHNMTSTRDCATFFVEISSAENEEAYKFCGPSYFKSSITALSNVTVIFRENPSYEYYGGDSYEDPDIETGFYLEYSIRDIECINKDSFKCNKTSCIPQAEVCDGIKDCEDGKDEMGCEMGVLTLYGVTEARGNAISCLKKHRNSSRGWREFTPRGVVALYLASDAKFNGTILEEELIVKETEIKIAVALLRSSLTNSELSMFIHALLVTCHDPRDFYGNNLVKRLKEQVETSQNVSHPLSYLALCNAHESWPLKAEPDLHAILNSSSEYPFLKDLQAMAILALSCKANSTDSSVTSSTSMLYKHVSENFKTLQMQDGSFGNLHTTALITQALIASGLANNKDWNLNATIQHLMEGLNSSSVDFLTTYLALPILNGKSLADVNKVNCSANPRKHGDDPVSGVNEYLGPKMLVKYTLYVGDETDVIHTISLRVPENYTAFQVMQLAEVEDHKYKFEWKMMSGKTYVHKIANISNDPETGKFWLLYVRSNEGEALTHFAAGPDAVLLKDQQELILWYKTASI